jgi:monoamine oxidase
VAQVAIIGAGLAGLSAARTLLEHGLDVEIFEASDRVGGRASTAYPADASLPIELGPEFVHGDPDLTRSLVRDPTIVLDDVSECHHMVHDGRLVEIGDMWHRFGELLSDAPGEGERDESARDYIARARMRSPDAELVAHFVEGFYGAELGDISIAGVAADSGGAGGDASPAQTQVRGGYGRVVASLAARIKRANLHLGCVVRSIAWRREFVHLTYHHGARVRSSIAERVITTLPLGVLHAGSVQFEPALRGAHRAALDKLAMGQVVKLVLRLREPIWDGHACNGLDFIHAPDNAFPTFWLRSRDDTHLLTAWAGGAHARALAGCSPSALVEQALDGFAASVAVARTRLAAAVVDHHFHDYAHDPFARGAYSYTRVGAGDAPSQLAQPLADTLFFAGEATDADYEGTVAGALASGERAAHEVLVGMRAHALPYRLPA